MPGDISRRQQMSRSRSAGRIGRALAGAAVIAALVAAGASTAFAANMHTTGMFKGGKVNGGMVTHSKEGGTNVLTLSDDFRIPDTPAPHWQVVDSKGNVYLLQMLKIKEDKVNMTIKVPSYVKDIARVQIWCSWAETLLGEASFEKPVM
jgi:hypothetical protein